MNFTDHQKKKINTIFGINLYKYAKIYVCAFISLRGPVFLHGKTTRPQVTRDKMKFISEVIQRHHMSVKKTALSF